MSAFDYTDEFAGVLAAERARIDRHRLARGGGDASRIVGLALSGGGIRSGSFALGVMQALAAGGFFRLIDYLSTVSGGGYTATMLTWLLRDGQTAFPFAEVGAGGALDWLRRQVDYLRPTERLTLRSLLAVVLQHAFFSLAVYGGLLVGFFFLLDVVDQALRPLQALVALYTVGPRTDWLVRNANLLLLASAGCLLLFLVFAVVPSVTQAVTRWRTRGSKAEKRAYESRRRAVGRAGVLLQMTLATFVVGTVPLVWEDGARVAAVAGVFVLLALAAVWRGGAGAAAPLVAFAILYGFLLLTHAVAMAILFGGAPWLIWTVVGGAAFLGAITSLGAHGSEGVYRDRLAETFMPNRGSMTGKGGHAAAQAAAYPLAEACGPETIGPYHLLNAAVLTTSSRATMRRERGADAFVFSPLYCGSQATGWRDTGGWRHGTTTLAAAMATSAAAVDPHAAVAGRGTTRNPLVSLALALLGLRLGSVAPNPRCPPPRRRVFPPNLLVPGIAQALFGDTRESGRYVTIADGGDFDLLGVYELIRRRVDLIFAVDATEDGEWTFSALGTLVERVRVDFGVEITLDDLDGTRPAPATGAAVAVSRRAHALGHVHYPARDGLPASRGVLVYVKATMLAGMPADVLAHARAFPAFPHESTLDQCFDEGKFEAYRVLGALAARRMLDDPAVAMALVYPDAWRPIDRSAV